MDQEKQISVGLLGAGHANIGIAGYLKSRGLPVAAWAPQDHPGALSKVRENDGRFRAYGIINEEFLIRATPSLEDLVASTNFLILGTRADAHELYVCELEKLNHLLEDTIIYVVNGIGFTMIYGHRLSAKHILESNLAPLISRLDDDKSAVNVEDVKKEMEMSCSNFSYGHSGDDGQKEVFLPEDVKHFLGICFEFPILPRTPFFMALSCVASILHFVPAVLNIGRLPDEDGDEDLTDLAREFISKLPDVGSGNFYGHWMNTAANRSKKQVDKERLKLAETFGLDEIRSLEVSTNKQYGTNFASHREYCAAPRHNFHLCTPAGLESRCYREDVLAFFLKGAIGKLIGMPMELTYAYIVVLKSCVPDGKPIETCGRELEGFTVEDLVRFGARLPNKEEMVLIRSAIR